MALMRSKRIKYLRIGFTMFKMTYEFHKRLLYVVNDLYMWEMA